MSASDQAQKIAFVDEVDDQGNVIEGKRAYAKSTYAPSSYAPSTYAPSVASPSKEKPNTGRARRERTRRDSSSPVTSALTDSDSTLHPRRDSLKKSPKEREKSVSSTKKAMIPAMRPQPKHAKTTPPTLQRSHGEASYYGITPAVTASSRPRAQTSQPRPQSYYNVASRPPPANARFYAHQSSAPIPIPTSFPPPSWAASSPGGIPYHSPSPAPVITQQSPDYFSRPLQDRFSTGRPQSAMSIRPASRSIPTYDDFEPENEKSLTRRSSRKVSRHEDVRGPMAPPPRPATTRPLVYRPPPPRRFEDDDLAGGGSLYRDMTPYEYNEVALPVRTRSRSRRPSLGRSTSISYDVGEYGTEVASKGRRGSYYGNQSASSGSAYEEQLRLAARYQDDVTGGTALPLTADALRTSRTTGSSRSTRSSGSHDESDFRKSATTRTTRSSTNDEDVTIRVRGSTVLKVGGAEMQCRDGAEINIISRGPTGYRTSSDKSSYMGQDDRRTHRIERPPARGRSSSQAPSSYQYAPESGYDKYYDTAPIPPYPAYPALYPPEGDYF
ncbi:hypothetical protein B0T19DRAFT_400761 [Cercophora scortea]|uniref:Uncharacterized protein n=1 Tax=Cercophora scortea TaxID=314031 RepID=A0AAE0IMN9_9PEZI|nr:hypothetical protein B0T19DRAFT_400761 [Cercophora scortea]